MRRWQRVGASQAAVVEYEGLPVLRVSKAFRRAADEAGLDGVSPHTLRHTAVTWAMQGGAPMFDASAVFGMSVKVLEQSYAHHHPDAGRSVHAAMERRRPALVNTIGDDHDGDAPSCDTRLLGARVPRRRTRSAQFDREQNVTERVEKRTKTLRITREAWEAQAV